MQRPIAGLDVTCGALTIAAGARRGKDGRVSIDQWDSVPLGENVLYAGALHDPVEFGKALRELTRGGKWPSRVRIGVGGDGLLLRPIEIPASTSKRRIESAVRVAASNVFPVGALDDAALAWQVLGTRATPDGAKVLDITAVTFARRTMTPLLSAIRSAGLSPVAVDVAAFGAVSALPAAAGSYALILCGAGQNTILIVRDGRVSDIIDAGSATLLPAGAAVESARGPDPFPEDPPANPFDPPASPFGDSAPFGAPDSPQDVDPAVLRRDTIDRVIRDLRTPLNMATASEELTLVLCGPAAGPDLAAALNEEMNMTVIASGPDHQGQQVPAVAAAAGLALKDLR